MPSLIQKKSAIRKMVILDYLVVAVSWLVFLGVRHYVLLDKDFTETVVKIHYRDVLLTLFVIPAFWIFIYYISGTYFDLYRKSRLNEVIRTICSCLLGGLLIGFSLIGNDNNDYTYFLKMTSVYIALHSTLTIICRILLLNNIKKKLKAGKVGFKTLIIGGGPKAIELYQSIMNNPKLIGYQFLGFVYSDLEVSNGISDYLPNLGKLKDLEQIIIENEIEEIIVAVDSKEHHLLENIVTRLSYHPVVIHVLPDFYDIISGSVKTSNVYGAVLIPIQPELMPGWQRVCKRLIDIFFSGLAILILLPLYVFAAIKVKLSSKGPIIYKQQRIGKYGKPFNIYKFRSMYTDSEVNGPALSSKNDSRITPWGKVMRKWRIDETPQFFNILIGDMSLVGPRPERQHFIDLISQTHPHYKSLHKVQPGLTSWGMVQYGYAENVDQMIERMKYDLLYIENCSLALDIKIMLHTILVILQGRGK